jgi:hypothetical protein
MNIYKSIIINKNKIIIIIIIKYTSLNELSKKINYYS